MSPTPKRPPMIRCGACGALNDPQRGSTRCRTCGASIMRAEITPFSFPATGQSVRTVLVGGEPWFVAADVCAVLDLHPGRALTRIDDDEKGMRSTQTPGGVQALAYVNEPGLYALVLGSRKPEAKAFKRWVTHEVLPAIRRSGSYIATPHFELPRTFSEALRAYAAEVEAREVAEARAVELQEPAEAWNVLASADPDYSVREAAYILNRDPSIDTGQNRLFNEMRRMRVIDSRDIPYSDHARHVKLRARSFKNRATGEEAPAKPQVRITAEGLAYLHRKLGGTAELQIEGGS